VELEYDTDTMVFHALRVFRNAFLSHCRSRLRPVFEDRLDDEIRELFKKEWEDIEQSARQAYQTGIVSRLPVDAIDYLSVNHSYNLLEKYWEYLAPRSESSSDTVRRMRTQLLSWSRELIGIRNPVAHAPDESLAVRDALRYIDSAARILETLGVQEAGQLRDQWNGLVADLSATSVAPPAILDTIPSREQITTDFVGRENHLTDLWRWLGEDTRRIWALIGDGGKGKTTIAYEFASQARGILQQFNLQGVLWLSAKKRRFLEGTSVPTSSADFSDLDSALDWILLALGWEEDVRLPTDEKLSRAVELLNEFPMLIIADDIDSLDTEDEQAVEFFAQHIPRTRSKALLTSRRAIFGLGSCTTQVAGMTEIEVGEFLQRRASSVGLESHKITSSLVRQVRAITDGSPLYIEDFLRLAQFYSMERALDQWSGRRGDAAREYSLRREMEKLSDEAVSVLGVLAYSDSPVSLEECAVVTGLTDDLAEAAMGELRNWNLLVRPGLVEDIPRYTCSRNLAKLLRRTLEGTDQEQRIQNGLKGLRGIVFSSARIRQFTQQAVALKQRGSQLEAEQILLQGIAEVPNSGQLHAMLGWLYSKWQPTPRVADAEENFERAEALGSWGRDLYAHWADMETRRQEYRKVTVICERAFRTAAKEDGFMWRLAGTAYTRVGEQARQSLSTEEAREAFERAERAFRRAQELSKEPGDLSRSLNGRYRVAQAQGEIESAGKILEEWESLLPTDPYLASLRR
jgi:tetratricopeptide (TPR) repeat protein